jgi:hypothetical protein
MLARMSSVTRKMLHFMTNTLFSQDLRKFECLKNGDRMIRSCYCIRAYISEIISSLFSERSVTVSRGPVVGTLAS